MIPDQLQLRTDTEYDRHPDLFLEIGKLARSMDRSTVKVLSFGCSNGDECLTLARKYLPKGSKVFGVDINPKMLWLARIRTLGARQIRIRRLTDHFLTRNAPFDFILALSVLCAWPETEDCTNCSEFFPFSRFNQAVEFLDSILQIGGYMIIKNSNFRFTDTEIAKRYRSIGKLDSGNVLKFTVDNLRLDSREPYTQVIFQKEA